MENIQKNSILIAFCLIMSFLSALEMQGRIRLVTRNDDDPNAFPTITGSLRWAIVDAQDGDSIVINQNITQIFLDNSIPISKTIVIIKLQGIVTIISSTAFPNTNYELFVINPAPPPNTKIRFINVNFSGTNANNSGRIALTSANVCEVQFLNCEFKNFISVPSGFGQVINMVRGSLKLIDCLFEDNSLNATPSNSPALISIAGPSSGDLEIRFCSFKNNVLNNALSGIIYVTGAASNLKMQFCRFESNRAAKGCVFFSSGEAKITDCVFTDNTASVAGGAIFMGAFASSSDSRIERCYFEANRTLFANNGGAIYVGDLGHNTPLKIANCTFWKNNAYDGGGIYVYGSGGSLEVQITNNTFVENIARNTNTSFDDRGAAIYSANANCTLDYNVAVGGTAKDFVHSGNGFKTTLGNNIYQSGSSSPSSVNGFNVSAPNTNATNTNVVNTTTVNNSIFENSTPNIAPQENGGFSKTFKPDLNSILIGRTPAVGGNVIDLPKLDQRLFPRGTLIDVGACERTPNPTGEIPESILMEITACNATNTATSNAVKLEWRDRLDLSTDNYIVLRNNINIATVTKQTGRKQVFSDESPIIGALVTYQIQANKKPAFQIDKYKSQKATISLFNDAISATDALNDKEVSIYPNPCKEKLFISLEKTLNLSKENSISIFSIFGQKIISQNISSQQIEVVLSENLRAGLYFVEIKQGEKRSIKKIIIE